MRDRREEILVLLTEIMGEIDGAPVENVYRNRPGLPPELRPCGLLLDGEERVVAELEVRPSGRGTQNKPLLVDLEPDLFYAMKTKPIAQHEQVGPEMSASRMAFIAAIRNSEDLARLLGPEGRVTYRGHTTDLKNGMQALGTQQFFFTFRYVLHPEDFT